MATTLLAMQLSSAMQGYHHVGNARRFIKLRQLWPRVSLVSMTTSTPGAYDCQSGIYTSDRRDIRFPDTEGLDFATFVLSSRQCSSGNMVALVDGNTGRELTFDQVEEEAKVLAGHLHQLGIEQGDVVMLLAPNSILYPIAVLAVALLGAVIATPSPAGSPKDVKFQAKLAKAKMVITTVELLVKTEALGLKTILIDDNGCGFFQVPNPGVPLQFSSTPQEFRKPRIDKGDPAAILYSSGTTGLSKAVVLSHANIVFQVLQLHLFNARPRQTISYDVPVCALPMSHIFGLVAVTLKHLYLRNRLVVLPGFELGGLLAAIRNYEITHLYVVPPVIVALAKLLQRSHIKHDLTSLRAVLCGAAPLGKKQVDALFQFLSNASFFQLYGITEMAGALTLNDTVKSGNTASVGTLLSNVEAKVLDVTDVPLPPYCQGELLLRSPTMMIGYMNNLEATKLSITSDGWLRTGDLVYFDERGNLFVVDRIKELIKYKALQVAPAELEALLLAHPQVADAAVVPYKDEDAGEIPMAFIVPGSHGELTERDIKDFVARHVASHKRVRKVAFVDVIPKTPSGKILRKALLKR